MTFPATMGDYEDLFLMNTTNANGQSPVYKEEYTLNWIIPLTIIYCIIFVAGILGNISTCVIIHKCKNLHTATNFYLFSLAISDLILLLFGLPLEVYKLWNRDTYPFGESMCIITSLSSETGANATVLTITAFTVERYIAICRPFMSHTISNLSRPVRFIGVIWMSSLLTAIPQAMQFSLVAFVENGQTFSACTVKGVGVHQVFVISSFIFFLVPMTTLTVLYVQIGIKLQTSRVLHPVRELSADSIDRARHVQYKNGVSQRRVIRMLIAVALSFGVCWAPFHVQRIIAIYGKSLEHPSKTFYVVYDVLTILSGVLYFLSTAINPILYSIMSNKFRNAFRMTLSSWCKARPRPPNDRSYSNSADSQGHLRHLRRFAVFTSQYNDAPPRAQCYDMSDPSAVFESTSGHEHWSRGWGFDLNQPPDSVESIRSISNSSLRECDEELTAEEMITYLFETNCHIRGLN